MERTLPSIIKQRIDTTANWTSKNPVLLKGEIGFEITSTAEFKQKVGDGTSKWSELPYSYLTPNEMKTEIKSNQVVVPGSLNLTDNGFYVKAGSNTLMSLKADGYGVHLGTRPLMGMTINLDCHRANDTIYSLSYHGEDESNYALGWSELSTWRENDITTEITPLRILAKKIEFNPDENGKESGVILDGVATPIEALHAVNKSYVDNSIASLPTYTLPIASTTTLGGIKIGDNITTTADGTISVPQLSDSVPGIIYAPEGYSGLERTDGYDTGSTLRISNAIQGRQIVFGMSSGNYYGILFGSQNSASTGAFMRPVSTGGMIGFELLTAGYNPSPYDCEITPANTFPSLKVSIMPVAGGSIIINPNNNGTASDLMIVASSVAMSGAKISNIGAPTNATDAANKAYVDSVVAGVGSNVVANELVKSGIVAKVGNSTASATSNYPLSVIVTKSLLMLNAQLVFNTTSTSNVFYIDLSKVRNLDGTVLNFSIPSNQVGGPATLLNSSGALVLSSVARSSSWDNATKTLSFSLPSPSGAIAEWKQLCINLVLQRG